VREHQRDAKQSAEVVVVFHQEHTAPRRHH
jgi:hypothetical protein